MPTIESVTPMSSKKKPRAVTVHYATMRDILGCDDPFERALAQICSNSSLELLPSLGAFPNVGEDSFLTGHKIIIVYPSLQQSIEIGLLHCVDIELLAERWMEMAGAFSQLFRENRSKIELIEVSGLKRNSDNWLTSLTVIAGMDQRALKLLQPVDLPDQSLTPLYFLYTQQIFPAATALMQELEAYSHPVAANLCVNDTPDLAPVITHLNETDCKDKSKTLTLLEEHLSVAMTKLAAAEAANSALKNEHGSYQELAGKFLALKVSMEEKVAQINLLENDIQAIRASHSWRITAPIRTIVSAVRNSPS